MGKVIKIIIHPIFYLFFLFSAFLQKITYKIFSLKNDESARSSRISKEKQKQIINNTEEQRLTSSTLGTPLYTLKITTVQQSRATRFHIVVSIFDNNNIALLIHFHDFWTRIIFEGNFHFYLIIELLILIKSLLSLISFI